MSSGKSTTVKANVGAILRQRVSLPPSATNSESVTVDPCPISYIAAADLFAVTPGTEHVLFGYDDIATALEESGEMPIPATVDRVITARGLRTAIGSVATIAREVFGESAQLFGYLEPAETFGDEELLVDVRYPQLASEAETLTKHEQFLSRLVREIPSADRRAMTVLPVPVAPPEVAATVPAPSPDANQPS